MWGGKVVLNNAPHCQGKSPHHKKTRPRNAMRHGTLLANAYLMPVFWHVLCYMQYLCQLLGTILARGKNLHDA